MKYDAFISYCRRDYRDENNRPIDGNFISRIKEALTAAGLTFWIDEEGVYSGNEFPEVILENILDSGCVIFVSTYNSNNISKWTSNEISLAKEEDKRIIPLICDNTPFAKGIKLILAGLDRIDLTTNVDEGMKKLVESVVENKERLLQIERERAEEERRRTEEQQRQAEIEKKLKKAKADLKILGENKEKLRKELSRLQGEYSAICKDYRANQAKIDVAAKVLTDNGETVNHLLTGGEEYGLDIRDLFTNYKLKESELEKLTEQISELNRENESLRAEIDRLKEQMKATPSDGVGPGDSDKRGGLMRGALFGIVGLAVGATIGFFIGFFIGKSCYHDQKAEYSEPAQMEEVVVAIDSMTVDTLDISKYNVITDGYVDMGTSVLWAANNYGADSPEDHGTYYDWNDISTKSSQGLVDGILPTIKEFNELKEQCTWKFGVYNGKQGYYVINLDNGNCIFLPITSKYNPRLESVGWGVYWSSRKSVNAKYVNTCSLIFTFSASEISTSNEPRTTRCAVRLVKQK